MTRRQLEYFLKTAETLNITKAAKELYISQPSLSEQIRRLETELGVALFERKERALKLTIAGKVLIGETYELFAKERELMEAVRTAGAISSRHLTIRYVPGMFTVQISDLTQRFHQLHPDIMLTLSDTNWCDLNDILTDGDYDVAFYLRLGDYEIPRSGHIDLAFSETAIVVPDHHPLAAMPQVHFEDIRYETFSLDILPRKSSLKFFSLYELFEQHHAGMPHFLPARNLDHILMNIRSGIAISVLSPGFMDELPKGMRFVPFPDIPVNTFSVYWSSKNKNPAIPMFIDFVQGNFIPPAP